MLHPHHPTPAIPSLSSPLLQDLSKARIVFLSEQRLCCSSLPGTLPKVSGRDPAVSIRPPGPTGSKPGGEAGRWRLCRADDTFAVQVTPLPCRGWLGKLQLRFLWLRLLPGDKQLLPLRRCRARSIPTLPG